LLADRPVYGPELEAFYAQQGGCAAFDPTAPSRLVRWLTRKLQARKLAVLRRVTRVDAGMRVLEVGCGRGAFGAYLAETVGCEVHGNDLYPLEPLPGVTYHAGPFTAELVGGGYDLIVAHHVVEHVYDPLAFIQAAHDALAPGGVVVLETVNKDCATFRRFGQDWGLLCAPRHTVLFSADFFRGLAAHVPFADVQVVYDGYARAVSPLAQSLVHRLRLPLGHAAGKGLAFALFALLNPWMAPLEIGLGLGRAVITVAARRA
jgi:SAM-dependent methyltransferase